MNQRLAVNVLHYGLIGLMLFQLLYSCYQVFVVLQPEGTFGPMWGQATTIPSELLLARRLYAIEGWVVFAGFAVYLGVTEINPRRQRPSSGDGA